GLCRLCLQRFGAPTLRAKFSRGGVAGRFTQVSAFFAFDAAFGFAAVLVAALAFGAAFFLAGAFAGFSPVSLSAAFVFVVVFLAFVALPVVPVLAIRSAISTKASSKVTVSGDCAFGMVALTLPQFTYGPKRPSRTVIAPPSGWSPRVFKAAGVELR